MIQTLFLRRKEDDPEADILLERLRSEGFSTLKSLILERAFRLEGIEKKQIDKLTPLFCNPVSDILTDKTQLIKTDGPVVEVGYQHAVTDPEKDSIIRGAESLGVFGLEWARISTRYQFIGLTETQARKIVFHYLYNPQVQDLISPEKPWDTLKPRGKTGPVESISLKSLDEKTLSRLSEDKRLFMSVAQLQSLQQIETEMQRPLTDAELEMFAQTWSDHCFHTTWKSLGLLKKLQDATHQIDHPMVLSSFEDNAGVMDFYDGWALTIKGETHNSPSAVSPYGGIMTKHGGVIRDTMGCGQGAKPIGGSTVMGLGDPRLTWEKVPSGALHPRTILLESIRGTADYNNPMGIPMMFPVYKFHTGYTGKCFALGHSIGILPSGRAAKGRPRSSDIAILFGGLTGRDGLHGATVSSGSMTSETSTVDAAHVQIGHPIEERAFMEAIPVLRDSDCTRAITDLGAGGLSSAAGEMGEETGIFINLARVLLKTEGMRPWEIWISESQERMLLCAPPEKVQEALDILDRYEVPAVIIGRFTDEKRCHILYTPLPGLDPKSLPTEAEEAGETVVDLTMTHLRKSCPLPDIRITPPTPPNPTPPPPGPKTAADWRQAVVAGLSHLNICDQSPAGTQFDSTVQAATAIGPYGGKDGRMPNDVWASTPIAGQPFAALTSLAFNPFYGDVNAANLAKLMILEAITKLVAAGVKPDDIVLCDNFYTPRVTPEIAHALVSMVSVCADLSVRFGTPFISGKDSSSGTFISEDGNRLDVPPTLCVFALGKMPDIRQHTPKPFQQAGNPLYLLGPVTSELGGSIYLDTQNQRGSALPDPDIETVEKTWKRLRELQKKGIIRSASALGEGGLIRRAFEMALGSGLGCRLETAPLENDITLFSESTGAVLIEVSSELCHELQNEPLAVPVGEVLPDAVLKLDLRNIEVDLPMPELISAWEKPFKEVTR